METELLNIIKKLIFIQENQQKRIEILENELFKKTNKPENSPNHNLDLFKSGDYWENRYKSGGNSGAGSYNRLAEFKAKIINNFCKKMEIKSVAEWGCGDGNQLLLALYPEYVGYDVSETAINICKNKFKNDNTKTFYCTCSPYPKEKFQLVLSLDVIYHLIEDNVFYDYMNNVFNSSDMYVCIYSSNFEQRTALHVKNRKFTDYVSAKFPQWKLIDKIENIYPFDVSNPDQTSWSDFYFYKKIDL